MDSHICCVNCCAAYPQIALQWVSFHSISAVVPAGGKRNSRPQRAALTLYELCHSDDCRLRPPAVLTSFCSAADLCCCNGSSAQSVSAAGVAKP
jgi:hypothetical protein